ncbi:run domain Beclin-1-interacting and cysteine-rich domain-containing protein-like isoform X1 [Brienomyrus brachyistius]|uniref:run domain Beclin-1-interacting and cysteine-rich domain-containing protein-like isoform X1 n=2 Tax=Brienomyrus brachyistius TaxID=42636 RepID=UPI0020B18D43|nr:run domain Beclin-1-interacting and cysteine-rich domain-containing protein-like isoform X1 [Brienomyrus brachyistius]
METESGEGRQEHWKLLLSLKTTVEGLLSTNNPNVWSHYGGLQRLHKDMNNILSHSLKNDTVYCKQKDYWPFVWCVRYICPQLASHVEQFNHLEPVHSNGVDAGEGHKAGRWLLHSLQLHCLSAQLQPLLKHYSHTRKFYNDDAFVLSEPYVLAMLQCLEAVEQNNSQLLVLIDTAKLWHLSESKGAELQKSLIRQFTASRGPQTDGCPEPPTSAASWPALWSHDAGEKDSPDLGALATAAQMSQSGPGTLAEVEVADARGGGLEDRPAYLAISSRAHQLLQSSRSSTSANGQVVPSTTTWDSKGVALRRRSSYSEGQGEPGRSYKGHCRSFSDTGLVRQRSQGSADIMYPEKEYGVTPSFYLQPDGSQYGSLSEGIFPKPSKGQSLVSFLSEQDFGSCADLEKENAHFSISELLIAAIELMKCNMPRGEEEDEEENDDEIQQLKQKIHLRRQQIRKNQLQCAAQTVEAFPSTDSSGSGQSSQCSFLSESGSTEEGEECEMKDGDTTWSCSKSLLSSTSTTHSFLQSGSAEAVAMGLLKQFEGMQLPTASELDWVVPEHEAPQKLLPIPDSLPISPDDGEHADVYKLRIRVRGNLEWAPPRPQIIFNIHPTLKRKVVVAKQNYRCAACGTRADPGYIKRLRYCEYVGRYFCQCCHENKQAVVPGWVLRKWDFAKHPVSNFAGDLLAKIAGDPLFNLKDINFSLYKKVKTLDAVRLLRVQLYHMKNLFKTCRMAKGLLELFDGIPCHLTEDLHLFSINDLSAVRRGELAPKLRELLRLGNMHVAVCVLCQAKGFVCEFCGNEKDIIFPFQLNKRLRCEECKTCYHRDCFSGGTECPKCRRLSERRERLARNNMEEQEEEGGGE